MQEEKNLTIISDRQTYKLDIRKILYICIKGRNAEFHISDGTIYESRVSLDYLEAVLGDDFIRIHRDCIVSAMAVHDITDRINLSSGESLRYSLRKRTSIAERLRTWQQSIIRSFAEEGVPVTEDEYRSYYSSFSEMPFAFADIEMVFNEKSRAVDWIFRYGNKALAELEKLPLEMLVGRSFSSIFINMDSKWLKSYERATLYGETLEMIDYSPEIDKYLKVICFPTFEGHCGCILFDISEIRFTKASADANKALMLYFGKEPRKKD